LGYQNQKTFIAKRSMTQKIFLQNIKKNCFQINIDLISKKFG